MIGLGSWQADPENRGSPKTGRPELTDIAPRKRDGFVCGFQIAAQATL